MRTSFRCTPKETGPPPPGTRSYGLRALTASGHQEQPGQEQSRDNPGALIAGLWSFSNKTPGRGDDGRMVASSSGFDVRGCGRNCHRRAGRRCAAAMGLRLHDAAAEHTARAGRRACSGRRARHHAAHIAGVQPFVHPRPGRQPVRPGRLVPGGPSGDARHRCPWQGIRRSRRSMPAACATIPTARAGPRMPTSPASSYDYIVQQLTDFRNGAARPPIRERPIPR